MGRRAIGAAGAVLIVVLVAVLAGVTCAADIAFVAGTGGAPTIVVALSVIGTGQCRAGAIGQADLIVVVVLIAGGTGAAVIAAISGTAHTLGFATGVVTHLVRTAAQLGVGTIAQASAVLVVVLIAELARITGIAGVTGIAAADCIAVDGEATALSAVDVCAGVVPSTGG